MIHHKLGLLKQHCFAIGYWKTSCVSYYFMSVITAACVEAKVLYFTQKTRSLVVLRDLLVEKEVSIDLWGSAVDYQ